jgi:hypothetical protein
MTRIVEVSSSIAVAQRSTTPRKTSYAITNLAPNHEPEQADFK